MYTFKKARPYGSRLFKTTTSRVIINKMLKLMGQASMLVVMSLTLAGVLLVAALLTAVEWLAPPSFSTSLASVEGVSAEAWAVFDPITGEVLNEHQAEQVLSLASVVKLPAAHVFYRDYDVFATTTITWPDLLTEGEAGNLRYGDTHTFHELLFPLLLTSSNDAAVVYERNQPNLVEVMNDYAASLGLGNTVFADASGLSAANRSTAREVARLVADINNQNQHLIDITGLEYYWGTTAWQNNSPFIAMTDYIGGKHGYTPEADNTAVAIFTESLQGNIEREVGYVLLGSANLVHDIKLLRNYVQNHVKFR